MSTAEILSLISTICCVIAAISALLAVLFWFAFKIPSVIGDLSGRTARKSIARMRASNERAGGRGYRTSTANANRGKLTDTMQRAQKLTGDSKKSVAAAAPKASAKDAMPETGLLETNQAVVTDDQQTELLESSESTALLVDEDATVPLYEEPKAPIKRIGGKKLTMLDEVILIHTDETIS